jgi:hypothetical protein
MKVQLRPVDGAQLQQTEWYKNLSGEVPTIAAVRDFPALRLGDSVQVDILYHPVTGEKISDVLRVITEDPQMGRQVGRQKAAGGERFSFERVKVVIDGKTVADRPNTWMICQAMKMQIPDHGNYYLVLAPTADFLFEAAGWVDHNILRIKTGGESIEITGMSNILKSEFGTVWVYHVPENRLTKKADSVDFHCADSFDQLKSAGSE